jgi:hypothetical protein
MKIIFNGNLPETNCSDQSVMDNFKFDACFLVFIRN